MNSKVNVDDVTEGSESISEEDLSTFMEFDCYNMKTLSHWRKEHQKLLNHEKETKKTRDRIRDEIEQLKLQLREDKEIIDSIIQIKRHYNKHSRMESFLRLNTDKESIDKLFKQPVKIKRTLKQLRDSLDKAKKKERNDLKHVVKRRKAIKNCINNMEYKRLERFGIISIKPELLGNIIEYVASDPKDLYNMHLSSLIHQISKKMDQIVWNRDEYNKAETYLQKLFRIKMGKFRIFQVIRRSLRQRSVERHFAYGLGDIVNFPLILYSCTSIGRLNDVKYLIENFKVSYYFLFLI